MVGPSAPVSIQTVSATETHDVQTGDGSSRTLLECGLPGEWVVADAVIKNLAASADRAI